MMATQKAGKVMDGGGLRCGEVYQKGSDREWHEVAGIFDYVL